MGARWQTTADGLPQMAQSISGLNGKKVQVGAMQGDNAWLAGIHEYGCNIPVTLKMRAYLHSQGIHLSPNKTHIHIPERSFLRTGHDENADRVLNQTERALSLVINGSMSIDELLDLYGEQMSTAIKKKIRDISSPPNSGVTIERKGSSNPLVDTGGLIESITWRKV